MFKKICTQSFSYLTKTQGGFTVYRHGSVKCGENKNKIAVILSGSGVYDGTEIHEISAIVVHLTRAGLEPIFYAPDIDQLHVIDHVKGSPAQNDKRNVLAESARIARGNIKALSALSGSSAVGLVVPGGFGAAKNLCDFALYGTECRVNDDVARAILMYHMAQKPIAMCCIAPVLAAKVLSDSQVTITLGRSVAEGESEEGGKWPHHGAIAAAKKLGATVEEKDVNEICFDEKNLLVTTPAFMYDGKFFEIFDGIGLMIEKLNSLVKKKTAEK